MKLRKTAITLLAGSACALCALGFALPTEQAYAETANAAFTSWEEGASIRIDTNGETSGIRFAVNFNADLYTALTTDETAELGMFIMPAQFYEEEEDMGAYVQKIVNAGYEEASFSTKFSVSQFVAKGTDYQVRGAMYGIDDVTMPFHALAYYDLGEGRVYSTLSLTRSIAEVADKVLMLPGYTYTDAQTEVLTDFVADGISAATFDFLTGAERYAFAITDEDASYTGYDEEIVSVENGVITPKKNGTTTVTVNAYGGALTKDVAVTVNNVNKLAITANGSFDSNIDATFYSLRNADVRNALNGAATPAQYIAAADSKPVGLSLADGVISVNEYNEGNYATWANAYLLIKLDGQTLTAGEQYVFALGTSSTITDASTYQVAILNENADGIPQTIRSVQLFDTAAGTIAGASGLKVLSSNTNNVGFFNGTGTVRFTVPAGEDLTNAYVLIRSTAKNAFNFSINSLRFGKAETKVAATSSFTAEKGSGEPTAINVTYYSLLNADVANTVNANGGSNYYKTGAASTYLLENDNKVTFVAEGASSSKRGYAMIKFDLGDATLAANTKYQIKFNSKWLSSASSTSAEAFKTMIITESLTTELDWKIYDVAVSGALGMKNTSYNALFGAASDQQYINFTTDADGAVSTFYVMVRCQIMPTLHFDISNITLKAV